RSGAAPPTPHRRKGTTPPRQFGGGLPSGPGGVGISHSTTATPTRASARADVKNGATTPPTRPPKATTELNRPRSPGLTQFLISPAAAGYAPASVTPSVSRTHRSATNPPTNPVAAVTSDQVAMDSASTFRVPNRSASAPIGI